MSDHRKKRSKSGVDRSRCSTCNVIPSTQAASNQTARMTIATHKSQPKAVPAHRARLVRRRFPRQAFFQAAIDA